MAQQLRLNRALLSNIATGQQQRNILDDSKRGYMSKMKVLTNILNTIEDYRHEALEIDEESGNTLMHTGLAKNIFKLKLPITAETGRLLFAAVSNINTTIERRCAYFK